MRRIRISKRMDEYTDTEFFPAGGSAVSPERVKARVLAQAMAAAPARRKQKMSRKKKLLLTAALAAAMVLLMAAGYPFFRHLLVNGELNFSQTADGRVVSFEQRSPLVVSENGRLYFTPEGELRVDITNLVSEETPYIYDGSDPGAGLTYYIIMGGTPECFGWFTWIRTPNPFDDSEGAPGVNEDGFYTVYGFSMNNEKGRIGRGGMGFGAVEWWDDMDHPWLLAGTEQLGITFVPTEEFEAMVAAEAK